MRKEEEEVVLDPSMRGKMRQRSYYCSDWEEKGALDLEHAPFKEKGL